MGRGQWKLFMVVTAAVVALTAVGAVALSGSDGPPTEPVGDEQASGGGHPAVPAGGPASVRVPSPDLGVFPDGAALMAALRASGPLNNEEEASRAARTAPNVSICADILRNREPESGTLVHQAVATIAGDHAGVLLVLRGSDGTLEARLYSTGAADPTGACRLIMKAAVAEPPTTTTSPPATSPPTTQGVPPHPLCPYEGAVEITPSYTRRCVVRDGWLQWKYEFTVSFNPVR